jgi:DNA-binding Lrp family transcriptional regulator
MTWREDYPPHPAAEIFPMLEGEDMDALVADIREHGVRVPVVLWEDEDGKLWTLDGRNRLEAAERAGVELYLEPGFLEESDRRLVSRRTDPVSFVISANAHRRHLTREQKRDAIRRLLELDAERSDRSIAKDVGVSHPTVKKVRQEAEEAGDVEKLSTRKDSLGRRQPARGSSRWRNAAKVSNPPEGEKLLRELREPGTPSLSSLTRERQRKQREAKVEQTLASVPEEARDEIRKSMDEKVAGTDRVVTDRMAERAVRAYDPTRTDWETATAQVTIDLAVTRRVDETVEQAVRRAVGEIVGGPIGIDEMTYEEELFVRVLFDGNDHLTRVWIPLEDEEEPEDEQDVSDE